jgi:hypothetical protein
MPRVIIVTRGFPPSFDSSSRRPWKLAKYLPEHGVEVTVVTRFRPTDPARFGLPDCVDVIGTDGVARDRETAREAVGESSSRPKLTRLVGRVSPVDGDAAWSMRAMAVAARIAVRRGVVVWATSGPPSLLVASLYWHLRRRIDYIADYRDIWTDAPVFLRTKSAVARSIARRLERMLLRRARLVTTVSGAWIPLLEARGARACHEISNGFDPDDRPTVAATGIPAPDSPFLAYAGRLRSGQRDAGALERFLCRLPSSYEIHYYGPDVEYFDLLSRSTRATARAMGLVPLDQLLPRIRRAGGLIAVGGEGDSWEARGAVPAKIYEYMLTERPILYLGSPRHEAARRMALYPRGFVVDPRLPEREFTDGVHGFLRAGADLAPLDPADRERLEARWGYPQLANRLAKLIREGRRP